MLAVLGAGALAVSTDLSDVRACHVLDGGDVLVGTGGGLARYDARGKVRAVWTAVDGLPGTRIDGISQVGNALWIGTEGGAAQVSLDGASLKVARTAVSGEAIDDHVKAFIDAKEQLALVLAERTLLDAIVEAQPVSFRLEKSGRLEKLQVVTMAKKAVWEKWLSQLEREPKLAQKPAAVARQPARRPVSDPRPFLPHVGKAVKLVLRNGLTLSFPLRAVGPFDLLCGPGDDEVFFVPLHAIVEWAG
jgi:hypothetical protein